MLEKLFLQKALKLCLVPTGIGTLITTICLTNTSKPLYKLDSLTLKPLPELEEEALTPVYVAQGGQGDGTSATGGGGDAAAPESGSDNQGQDDKESKGDRKLEGGDEEEKGEGKKKGEEVEEEEEQEDSGSSGGKEEGIQNLPEILQGGKDTLEEIIQTAVEEINNLNLDSISSNLGDMHKLTENLGKIVAAAELLKQQQQKPEAASQSES